MSCRWVAFWLILFLAGCGLMYGSYHHAAETSRSFPYRVRLLIPQGDQVEKAPDEAHAVWVRFLPSSSPTVAALTDALRQPGTADTRLADTFRFCQQEALILLPSFEQVLDASRLAWGRLPTASTNEVLAGHAVEHQDQITIGEHTLHVVGVLPRTGRPLSHAYLLAGPQGPPGLFDPGEGSQRSFLLVQSEDEPATPASVSQEHWLAVGTPLRTPRGDYYAYLAGLALLLTAGSALLVAGYLFLARRVRNHLLGPPLAEIERRLRLLLGLHVVYFGLYLAAALLIYELPLVQDYFGAIIAGEVQSGQGLLGKAGEAYASKNVAWAAGTTLLVNFVLGSLLLITLPSAVVPSVGLLLALCRALVWGVVLAPANLAVARAMLWHSGTLLLEGEGYILASFFALLVAIYLFSPQAGPGAGRRYGWALVLNLKGNVLVFLVLAGAALYEATEVILQMRE